MFGIIYLYKQNLMNVLSKLQILASRATIGVSAPFLWSSIFFETIGFKLWLYTGCPKRYETFLNLNKSPTFKLGIPKYPKYKIIYSKKLFQGIASIILCKHYVSGNVKYGVTKYNNFNKF